MNSKLQPGFKNLAFVGTAESLYIIHILDFRQIEIKLTQLVHEKGALLSTMIMNLILCILSDEAHMILGVSKVKKKASIW
jgi:hypothetical protein